MVAVGLDVGSVVFTGATCVFLKLLSERGVWFFRPDH